MKIAIIGAGFAGLATAYFFLKSEQASVTLFEGERVGGGASGVCSGLLHPYPGLSARRSFKAEEALLITKQLIRLAEAHTPKSVATQGGILRKSLNEEQQVRLLEHCMQWKDIEQVEQDLFLIHSGITVHSRNYLEGLFQALVKMGIRFVNQQIHTLEELREFDHIVIAAGYGVRQFPECRHIKIKFLKGQALQLQGEPPFERSCISKGYIAHFGGKTHFELGSTYESQFENALPEIEKARVLLSEKLQLCPNAKIIACHAGVRVAPLQHYLPIIEHVHDRTHVFTGLGSRGLLYHGLYGRALAHEILSQNASLA